MDNAIRLVAISGRKRSGKGTTASWFIENDNFAPVKFADTLKRMLKVLFEDWGLNEALIERLIESDLKELPLPWTRETSDFTDIPDVLTQILMGGKSSRYAMQKLGTEWRDMLSLSLWTDVTERRIHLHWAKNERVVVDDMRFPHELESMRDMGALLIKVRNPKLPPNTDTHASEQELPDHLFDIVLDNDGTIAELHCKVANSWRETCGR